MPHATEGELHAYLDGALAAIDPAGARELTAHLGRCADCAARLEEERAIRGRANELLDLALPAPTPPPFETLAGGAGAGGTGGGRRRPAPERMAWAAGVVLALAAGWMGHAMLRGTGEAPTPVAQLSEAAPKALERGDREAFAATEGTANEAGRTAERSAGRQEAEAVPAAEELRDAAAQSLDVVGALASSAWRATDLDGAAAWGGRMPLVVPDLEIVEVAVVDSAGARFVRIRQALGEGSVLELVEEVAGPDDASEVGAQALRARVAETPAVTPPAEEAPARAAKTVPISEIRTTVDGVVLRATAPLARDSLAALVSRARPPEP